jgi:DNA-binding GntR family transcriptional regulator
MATEPERRDEVHLPHLGDGSRRHRVAQVLREAITSGRLKPGDKLVELDLAAQLGTSRSPVREALRQLENEGLVVSFPYRGTEVMAVSQDEIEHMLVPVRMTVERFAFTRALPLLEQRDLDELQRLVTRMRTAATNADEAQLAELDVRFHEYVIERSGHLHCLQVWRTIEPRVRAYFRRDAARWTTTDNVPHQHEVLLDALRSGDEQRVVTELERHINTHTRRD